MIRSRIPEQLVGGYPLVGLVQKELESKGYFVIVIKRPDYSILSSSASRHQVDMAISKVKDNQVSEAEWIAETRLECA
tara:strand:- start:2022 stop:2255 length:234 start_codon:yes stop_codon:yes gene_type:complete